MAAYIASSQAQDVVLCKYCQKSPAEFYCHDCGDELCSPCQDSHKKHYSFANHVTVSYDDRKTGGIPCKEHPGQFYIEACKSCGIPICPECKVKSHYSHSSIDINNLCVETVREMKKSLIRMERRKENVDFYIQKMDEVDRSREEVKENLRKRAMVMKSCIDDILSASIAKIEKSSTETANGSVLKNKLENEKRELNLSLSTMQSVLKADPIDQVFYVKEHPNWNKVPKTKTLSTLETPIFEPHILDQNDLLRLFGSLSFVAKDVGKRAASQKPIISETPRESHTSNRGTFYADRSVPRRPSSATFYSPENVRRSSIGLLENPKLVFEIKSMVNLLYHIAYSNCNSSMYVSGYQHVIYSYKKIPQFSKKSPMLTALSVLSEPQGLTVDTKNNIVYTDRKFGIIEIHRNLLDDTETWHEIKIDKNARIIFRGSEYSTLWGVHCTMDGTYLICQTGPSAIVQLCKEEKREIKHNLKGEELFAEPRYVCENITNQNICVSDFEKGVIVLTQAGQFLFNYRGRQFRWGQPFSPRGIACDGLGRILIADTNNDVVHLLEKNGEFITYILSSISPISQPWGLCVDSQNRVWVAERNLERNEVKTLAKVKVFQIYKS